MQGEARLRIGHVDPEKLLNAPDPHHHGVAVQAQRGRGRGDARLMVEIRGERGEQLALLPAAARARTPQRGRTCRSPSTQAGAVPARGCRRARTILSRSVRLRCARHPRFVQGRGEAFRSAVEEPTPVATAKSRSAPRWSSRRAATALSTRSGSGDSGKVSHPLSPRPAVVACASPSMALSPALTVRSSEKESSRPLATIRKPR